MSRFLNVFGVGLILIGVVSAVGAPGAQAANAQLTAASNPAILDGIQTTTWVWNRLGRKVTCQFSSLSATAKTGATTVTVTPTFENCTTSLGSIGTVEVKGCDYLLHLTADAVDNFTADTDVVCESGGHIVVNTYTNNIHHEEGKIDCQFTFNATGNQGLSTVKLTNHSGANNDIDADIELKGITSTRTMGSTLLCGAEKDSTGTFEGGVTLRATTETGGPNGVTVSTD